jgi:radical SAM protein with 4Fe4S-binding SPASM domain
MTPLQNTNQREFLLDQTINIPRRLSEYVRGNKTLFVATLKAAFLTVDAIGADFIHLFEDGVTLRNALAIVEAKYGNKEDVIRSLGDLLVQIETKNFYQHAEVREDPFDSLTMLARLTNRCNLRCIHCHVSSAPDWPTDKDLDTASWCAVLDEYSAFAKLNGFARPRVTFTGGEALVRLDAFDILEHSKALGLPTELYTNGVLIVNSRMASRIASVVDEVQISFDGATAEIHDQVRGKGMFDRTVRGAKLLGEANVRFRFSVVVMPQNYQDLMDNLPDLIRSIGSSFNVKLGLASIEGRANRSMQFPTSLEAENKLKALVAHLSREGVRNERPITNNLKQTSCGYGRELTVDSDGLVYGCGPQMHSIGNLKIESFAAIAERTVKKSKNAEIDLVEGCRECDIRYVCGGICRLNNMSRMGSATISSCDRANKERNILKLFGRSGDFIPINLLQTSNVNNSDSRSVATGLVPISGLIQPTSH